jgi:hypothetical protein
LTADSFRCRSTPRPSSAAQPGVRRLMKIIPLLLTLLLPDHAEALSIIRPDCPSDDAIIASIEDSGGNHPLIAVLAIESQTNENTFTFRTLEPSIKGTFPERGELSTEFCTRLTFPGDIVLALAFPSANGKILLGQSVRLYSQQWHLIWSESAIAWLENWRTKNNE